MIAVIFEVWLAENETQNYLDLAAALRADLAKIDGFVSIERFESLAEPGKLLSLSFFRDEEAVAQSRNIVTHRMAQKKGRGGIFSGYRLRVANVLREYGLNDREQAPADSNRAHGA